MVLAAVTEILRDGFSVRLLIAAKMPPFIINETAVAPKRVSVVMALVFWICNVPRELTRTEPLVSVDVLLAFNKTIPVPAPPVEVMFNIPLDEPVRLLVTVKVVPSSGASVAPPLLMVKLRAEGRANVAVVSNVPPLKTKATVLAPRLALAGIESTPPFKLMVALDSVPLLELCNSSVAPGVLKLLKVMPPPVPEITPLYCVLLV